MHSDSKSLLVVVPVIGLSEVKCHAGTGGGRPRESATTVLADVVYGVAVLADLGDDARVSGAVRATLGGSAHVERQAV